MVRKFNIEISIDYGWEIEIDGFNGPYKNYKPIKEAPISFGICVREGNKLIAMYDPFCPQDEAIKEANKQEIFREECEFIDKYNKHNFKGDFVDALLYIQQKYVNEEVPTLEEIENDK